MIRFPFYSAGLCVLVLASACHSTPDTAANAAGATANKAAAPAAQAYPVLTLTPQNAQLHLDYPAVLQAAPQTGKARAYFRVSERAELAYQWNKQDSTVAEILWQMCNVELVLANGAVYSQRGCVAKTTAQVDPASGSVAVKATFANPGGELRTGAKAVVRLPLPIPKALLVPQAATYEVQGKRCVFVLGPDNRVIRTEIKVLPFAADSSYVVRQGLKAGDQIVARGAASLREGQRIVPHPQAVALPATRF